MFAIRNYLLNDFKIFGWIDYGSDRPWKICRDLYLPHFFSLSWSEVKDRLQDNALNLSGGQKQRLCIARTLALQPEILLMDEPCSALDPMSSAIVEDLIVRLRQKYGYTIIIVTHNLAQAKRIADYAALFWVTSDRGCGRLIEFAPAEQFFNTPTCELTKAYINGSKG